jgi:hypothetical protein
MLKLLLVASSSILFFLPAPSAAQGTTSYWGAGEFKIEQLKVWLSFTYIPNTDWFSVAVVEPKNVDYHDFKIPTVLGVNCKTGDFSFNSGYHIEKDGQPDIDRVKAEMGGLAKSFCESHKNSYGDSTYWN